MDQSEPTRLTRVAHHAWVDGKVSQSHLTHFFNELGKSQPGLTHLKLVGVATSSRQVEMGMWACLPV